MAYVAPRIKSQMADSSVAYDMSVPTECPYDRIHVVAKRKMPGHLAKCSLNYPDNPLRNCSYNSTHQLPQSMIEEHMRKCPDRAKAAAHGHVTRVLKTSNLPSASGFAVPFPEEDTSWSTTDSGCGVADGFGTSDADAFGTVAPPALRMAKTFSPTAVVVDSIGAPVSDQNGARAFISQPASRAAAAVTQPFAGVGRGRAAGRGRGTSAVYVNKPRRPGGAVVENAAGGYAAQPAPAPAVSQPTPAPPAATPYAAVSQSAPTHTTATAAVSRPSPARAPGTMPPPGFAAIQRPASHVMPLTAATPAPPSVASQNLPDFLLKKVMDSRLQPSWSIGVHPAVLPPAGNGHQPELDLDRTQEMKEQKEKLGKVIRRCEKLVNQIQALERKLNQGHELDADQVAKVARKSAIQQELADAAREKLRIEEEAA